MPSVIQLICNFPILHLSDSDGHNLALLIFSNSLNIDHISQNYNFHTCISQNRISKNFISRFKVLRDYSGFILLLVADDEPCVR